MTDADLTIVGIGADGWRGLGERARAAVRDAVLLIGSHRQLELVPHSGAERRRWPSPIDPLVDELVAGTTGPACVLASGDPMLHGIGATLARRVRPERLIVLGTPSAFSLACARLGWPGQDVDLVSLVGHPSESLVRWLQPGRHLIVYTHGPTGVDDIVRMSAASGYGSSRIVVLERLGGPDERLTNVDAEHRCHEPIAPYLVAVECRADAGASSLALTPGLPDDAYEHDGQLTKREVRAVTLAMLGPLPDRMLWDVGAGSGSIAIEWLRAESSARAIAIESDADRAQRITTNARRLGVPRLDVRHGIAPDALAPLDQPDAIFIGGGVGAPGLLECCWERLVRAGVLVANVVTLEGEQRLVAAQQTYGGSLVRISIDRAEPLGRRTGWRAQFPVVQWSARKP